MIERLNMKKVFLTHDYNELFELLDIKKNEWYDVFNIKLIKFVSVTKLHIVSWSFALWQHK